MKLVQVEPLQTGPELTELLLMEPVLMDPLPMLPPWNCLVGGSPNKTVLMEGPDRTCLGRTLTDGTCLDGSSVPMEAVS